MSFYTDASLVLIPSGIKDQKVYCAKPIDGSADLTFSRASNATRVNSSGLVEKVRTNEIPYSQDFDNAQWSKDGNGTGVTPLVTANNATAPDGTLTADTIVFDAGAGTTTGDSSVVYQSITATGLCTASFYARVTSGSGQLVFRSVGGSWYTTANLTTTWQRFSAAENGSSGFFEIGIRRGLSNEPINASVTAELWGAQLETGDIATDYIATTSSAVRVGPVSGLPRLDYSGGASCPSLLLEPERTNLVPYSEQLVDTNYPSSYNITSVQNSSVSPDGYTNADTLSLTNTGLPYGFLAKTINGQAAGSYTFSVFAKAGTTDYAFLQIYVNLDPTPNRDAYFNLANGSVESTLNCTASIEDYGSGWYRCIVTTTTSATYNLDVVFQPSIASSRSTTGNAIFWGAQLEAGAYASSYIPTLSTAVTRVKDVALTASVPSLIGQTEGTLYAEMTRESLAESFFMILSDIAGTTALAYYNSIYIFQLPNANFVSDCFISNVAQYNFSYPSGLSVGTHKIALAYKQNDFALYIDGVQIATDTSGNLPTMNYFTVGGGADVTGHKNLINQTLLFKTRLSNADLATLTA